MQPHHVQTKGQSFPAICKANPPQAYEEEPVTPVVLSFIDGEYPMAQVSVSKAYPRIIVV